MDIWTTDEFDYVTNVTNLCKWICILHDFDLYCEFIRNTFEMKNKTKLHTTQAVALN